MNQKLICFWTFFNDDSFEIKLFVQTIFFYFLNSVFFLAQFFYSFHSTISFISFNSYLCCNTMPSLFRYLWNLVNFFSFIHSILNGNNKNYYSYKIYTFKKNKHETNFIIHLHMFGIKILKIEIFFLFEQFFGKYFTWFFLSFSWIE